MLKCRSGDRWGVCRRSLLPLLALLPAFWNVAQSAAPAAAADSAPPFRLCADPENLPFSATSRDTPGYYIELGRAIANRLGRRFEPVWEFTYFAKRAVRTTLLAGRCDGFIGPPDDRDYMGQKLIFSKPVLEPGYALVLPHGMSVKALSDLVGRRVAMQFASPPQNLLATRDDIQMVTALSPEEAMRDLSGGRADLAFIWGPSAGWLNRTTAGGAYDVIPVAGPHMQWRAVIGFAAGDTALRDQVNAALDALRGEADALMKKYGFPSGSPVSLAASEETSRPASAGPARDSAASDQTAAVVPTSHPVAASSPDAHAVDQGHHLFNENCSHCHGPDAVEGERRRNLRLLHHRCGDGFDKVFITTVTHGRVERACPTGRGSSQAISSRRSWLTYIRSRRSPDATPAGGAPGQAVSRRSVDFDLDIQPAEPRFEQST
jgi:polar amino acid transport system substrate-binding protein